MGNRLPFIITCVMKQSRFLWLFLSVFIYTQSCKPVYQSQSVQFKGYRVGNAVTDSSMSVFLKPYSDSLNKSMNAVVAVLGNDLEKSQPEGTLGNFMADAMFVAAKNIYGEAPDIAVMNYGGIRLPVVKAGSITRGKLFELFPFDNVLVLLKLKGDVLQQFLDHIAGRGGWPVSGMTMQMQNKKAVNVIIGGKPIDPAKTYTVALGDYTANGGDDAAMLKGILQLNKGYLMRDAIIDYFSSFQKAGKTIYVQKEKRVSNVE